MLMLNGEKIKAREKELIRFKGFIPTQLFLYLDNLNRSKFLKSIGRYDEIEAMNIRVRNGMKTADDPDAYMDLILRKWIADNPKFKDLVIDDDI